MIRIASVKSLNIQLSSELQLLKQSRTYMLKLLRVTDNYKKKKNKILIG